MNGRFSIAACVAMFGCAALAKDVTVSSFGFDAADSTRFLQAALDSGVAKVVVDRQTKPWVTGPLFLRSNQTVVFEGGVRVEALPGGYKDKLDWMLNVENVSNVVLRGEPGATLRMRKCDYRDPSKYAHSEWRHLVSIVRAANVTVSGLSLESSGGDGVYVAGGENVRLIGLVMRDNYRQGLSVISARRLLVKDCIFESTEGTPPACGVDFEPNRATDVLEKCALLDCVFTGNAASGLFFNLGSLTASSKPVSILIRNCHSVDNGMCGYGLKISEGSEVGGRITFDGCTASGNRGNALMLSSKSVEGLEFICRACTFDAAGSSAPAVFFANNTLAQDFGNVVFEDVRVKGCRANRALEFSAMDGVGCRNLSGRLDVEQDGAKIDLAAFAAQHPSDPEKLRFGVAKTDFRAMTVPASAASKVDEAAEAAVFRYPFTFVQTTSAPGEYAVTFRSRPIGNGRLGYRVVMRDRAGTDAGMFLVTNEVQTYAWTDHGNGLRRFEVNPGGCVVSVGSAHPGHGVVAADRTSIFRGRNLAFHFLVPAEATEVRTEVAPARGEPASAELVDPSGKVVAAKDKSDAGGILKAEKRPGKADEVWCLRLPYVFEDCQFRIGSPAVPVVAPTRAGVVARRTSK